MNQTLYHMNEGASFFPDNPDFTHDSRIELIESKARFDSLYEQQISQLWNLSVVQPAS